MDHPGAEKTRRDLARLTPLHSDLESSCISRMALDVSSSGCSCAVFIQASRRLHEARADVARHARRVSLMKFERRDHTHTVACGLLRCDTRSEISLVAFR